MKKLKMNKGITLIALIITIIVLLILAAVAISAIKGDGIISHAKNAKSQYSGAQTNEQDMLSQYEYELWKSQETSTGTYGEYTINKELNEKYPGLKVGDKVNYTVPTGVAYNGDWRVLGIENGQVLITAYSKEQKNISGSNVGSWDNESKSFKEKINELNNECISYVNNEYATKSRSINAEDVNKVLGTNINCGKKTLLKKENEKYYYSEDEGKTYKEITGEMGNHTDSFGFDFSIEPYLYIINVEQNVTLKGKVECSSNVFEMLLGDNPYWLANSFITISNYGTMEAGMTAIGNGYYKRCVAYQTELGFTVYDCRFWNGNIDVEPYVRPVVYLKPDITLTELSTDSGVWNVS